MTQLLALDLSTTACGWSLWCIEEQKLVDSGTYLTPTDKFIDNFAKIDFLVEKFSKISADLLFVEEALQKLSGGNSSSKVIAKLVQMNFAGTYALKKAFGDCPHQFLDVRAARKSCGIKVARGENAKKIVFEFVKTKFPELEFKYKKTGNPKDFELDRCDSIIIGLAALNLILS